MNKSDFISDAVALDLGKSGVKVAETLELKVGDEWWNLINSNDTPTVSVFDKRMVPPPLVSEGIMDVSLMEKRRVSENGTPKTLKNPMLTAIFQNGNVVVVHGSAFGSGGKNLQTQNVSFVNVTTGVTTTNTVTARSGKPWFPMYYDPFLDKVCFAWGGYSNYYGSQWRTADIDSDGIIVASTTDNVSTAPSADYYKTFSLPEAQEKAYSIFWTDGVQMKLKTVIHQSTDTTRAKTKTLSSNSGAVALTAVPLTAVYSAGAYMFFLRQAESVGIAFMDSADSRIKYVLESENWETLHTLPDFGNGSATLDGFGTVTTPLDGEFFMAHFRDHDTGNLGKPVGHDFPANMVVNGFTRTGEKNFRMFGSVGAILYSYTLDPDTMTLTYNGVAYESWAGGALKPVMLAYSGSLELIRFGTNAPKLMLYDGETNTVVWWWDNWTSAKFPTYAGSATERASTICSCSSRPLLFFFAFKTYYYDAYVEAYTIPIDEFFTCTTTDEVNALFTPERRGAKATGGITTHTPQYPMVPEEGGLMVFENETHYIYPITQLWVEGSFDAVVSNFVGISKTDPTQVDRVFAGSLVNNSSTEDTVVQSLSLQTQLSRHTYDQDMTVTDGAKDGLIRITAGYGIRFITPLGAVLGGPVGSNGGPQIIYTGKSWGDSIWRYYPVVCNEKGVGMFVAVDIHQTASTIRMVGAYFDGTTASGQVGALSTALLADNVIVDAWNNIVIITGAITGGEIPFVKVGARTWDTKYIKALSVRDGSFYDVSTGDPVSGGIRYFHPSGSLLYWISNTGFSDALQTGSLWTDGMGDEGEIGDAPSVIAQYKNNSYIPYPFMREGIKVELSNISKMTKVTIPETQSDLIRTMIASGTDFRGSRCILRRVFPDHAENEMSDIVLLDGYVQDWSYSPEQKGILFTVSKTLIDIGSPFPRRLMNMGCSHVFKGTRCGYLGNDGICTKTKADCTSKGNIIKFGGFPWVAARQRRVMWR